MKPVVVAVLALATALAVLAIIWIAPAVRTHDSACEQYPLTSNCR